MRFLLKLPDHLDIEIGARKLHLVHGFPADNTHRRIWASPYPNHVAPISGTTVVVGHTPTAFLNCDMDNPCYIWHGDGIIGIDCGCGHNTEITRLACLRLDDLKEFYV